jgi:hypothetical protein
LQGWLLGFVCDGVAGAPALLVEMISIRRAQPNLFCKKLTGVQRAEALSCERRVMEEQLEETPAVVAALFRKMESTVTA